MKLLYLVVILNP